MNKQLLTKIISQIRKYNLTPAFANPEALNNWLNSLKGNQITNLINLDVNPEEIMFPRKLLINPHLLNCHDYHKRVSAMSKLKNGEGCWLLFERLCSPNFLNSKHYYQDLELISQATTARYPLWIIDNDDFINSQYHTEDLKLIVESLKAELNNDIQVPESLATVASNKESINSPYHRQDMDLIFQNGRNCLQPYGTYPERSINNLATNHVSLHDPYHLENMKILLARPVATEFLYQLMTDANVVKNQYYREEITALNNAKSIVTAIAMYYYITNPQESSWFDFSSINYYELGYTDEIHQALNHCYRFLGRKNNLPGHTHPQYLKYLKLLNDLDDKFVVYFESLLSNKNLLNSRYHEADLNLLLEITDPQIYLDLYSLMTDPASLNSSYHFNDALLISKTESNRNRSLLLKKATNEESLNSPYHEYDMLYISKLNLSTKIKDKIYDRIYYYLFIPQGMNAPDHIIALEKLAKGEMYEPINVVSEYLTTLENQLLPADSDIEEFSLSSSPPKETVLTRIRRLFNSKK